MRPLPVVSLRSRGHPLAAPAAQAQLKRARRMELRRNEIGPFMRKISQKFVYKGLRPVTKPDQGAPWPGASSN